MKTFRMLLAVLAALAAASLLLSLADFPHSGPTFIYTFGIVVAFGWYVYVPFAFLHGWLVRQSKRPGWAMSALVGAALAVGFVGALVGTPFTLVTVFPRFSASRAHDVISFALGGGVYGLLAWKWAVGTATAHGTKR